MSTDDTSPFAIIEVRRYLLSVMDHQWKLASIDDDNRNIALFDRRDRYVARIDAAGTIDVLLVVHEDTIRLLLVRLLLIMARFSLAEGVEQDIPDSLDIDDLASCARRTADALTAAITASQTTQETP